MYYLSDPNDLERDNSTSIGTDMLQLVYLFLKDNM